MRHIYTVVWGCTDIQILGDTNKHIIITQINNTQLILKVYAILQLVVLNVMLF